MQGRFIISTGRSGSTLLSNMVAENKKVLVLSEFTAGIEALALPLGEVSGAAFAEVLYTDDGVTLLLRQRNDKPKEMLSAGRPGGPVSPKTGGTPMLLRTAFPAMSTDPEALFLAAVEFARAQPTRPMGEQLRALFDWLCERLGKEVWVERSGFGIRMFPWIRAAFPEALFLHLHRDGLESALSMYSHPWFRLGVYWDSFPPDVKELAAAIRNPSLGSEDPVSKLRNDAPPVEIYGRHWSNMLCRAYRHLAHVPPERYTEMKFEDIAANTKSVLAEVARFLKLPDDPGWIDRAAKLVEKDVPLRAPKLSPDERAKLEAACLPGQILLGRANPSRLEYALDCVREAHALARTTPGDQRS